MIALIKKAYEQPARLASKDLAPVRELVGDGALDYALVMVSFHFVNRIADLLGIVTEFLPASLRRFEFLRRTSVQLLGIFMKMMDLANRPYGNTYDAEVNRIAPLFQETMGRHPGDEFESIRARPKLIEAIRLSLEERDQHSSLDRYVMAKIHHTVEKALPERTADLEGFHTRPDDPVEAFAFVGTRYAHRTTREMINLLREEGIDDLGLLDLAIAIADANQWARLYRLLDLPPELYYLETVPKSSSASFQ